MTSIACVAGDNVCNRHYHSVARAHLSVIKRGVFGAERSVAGVVVAQVQMFIAMASLLLYLK